MIKADNKKWANTIFRYYMMKLLKNNFSHFYLSNDIPDLKKEHSYLFTPNHISWWDGFFIGYFNYCYFNRVFHIMMLERQLVKYSFFKKLGAYSIDPSSRESVSETLEYTASILKNTKNIAIMYPQGKIIQQGDNYTLKKGLTYIPEKNETPIKVIIPFFRINYFEEKLPEIWVHFSEELTLSQIQNDFAIFENTFKKNEQNLLENCFSRSYKKDLFND